MYTVTLDSYQHPQGKVYDVFVVRRSTSDGAYGDRSLLISRWGKPNVVGGFKEQSIATASVSAALSKVGVERAKKGYNCIVSGAESKSTYIPDVIAHVLPDHADRGVIYRIDRMVKDFDFILPDNSDFDELFEGDSPEEIDRGESWGTW